MMPPCDLHEWAEAYALGALEPDERGRYRDHLSSCPNCRREIRSYRAVVQSLDTIEYPLPPPMPAVRGRRVRAWWYPGAVLAAALAAALFLQIPGYLQVQKSERDYAAIALMLATDIRQVTLGGTRGIRGAAIVGAKRARTGFVVAGLQAAPGATYRIWVRRRSGRFSPGVLERTPEGLFILVTAGDALAGATEVAVTIEERGTSAADQPVVLSGNVE